MLYTAVSLFVDLFNKPCLLFIIVFILGIIVTDMVMVCFHSVSVSTFPRGPVSVSFHGFYLITPPVSVIPDFVPCL